MRSAHEKEKNSAQKLSSFVDQISDFHIEHQFIFLTDNKKHKTSVWFEKKINPIGIKAWTSL